MMKNSDTKKEYSSFRDPAGYLYREKGTLYRCIKPVYYSQYRRLMQSGLYDDLIRHNALIPHEEIKVTEEEIIICPREIDFVSYPYEWSFGMLKDAALLTLKIHRRALRYGMILKDASAYNIQFDHGRAVLIDTLSFDFYQEGEPWGAYGQFCRHFLAPLILMKEKDVRSNRLLSLFIDGIPLDMAASFLGTKGGFFAKQHIAWHAKSIADHAGDGRKQIGGGNSLKSVKISKDRHMALVNSLIRGIEKITLSGIDTEWGDYYEHTNYSKEAEIQKETIVRSYLELIEPKKVWDLGANDGKYSKLALESNAQVVAFDIDPLAVEHNYAEVKKNGQSMLPLILDLTNPSPGIGFANEERETVQGRQNADCVMALALIHHLAISNNLPLSMIAEWLSRLSKYLIIEFVPKRDSQVQVLLATREDIFPGYNQEKFEEAFDEYYHIRCKKEITGSLRSIYLMERKH